ncbi:MAG TPA: DUF3450 family protein [Opitutaceae bacterium]|nr:DUF3450 family protein [Opitutaceae bacterium]
MIATSVTSRTEPDPLDEVERATERWLDLRMEAARVETAWKSERVLLESLLAANRDRAALEEDKRDLVKARTAKDREEIEGLRTKADAAQNDLREAEERLKVIDAQLVQLRPSLPPRLSAGLENAFRTLAKPQLNLAERMQMTVQILNRCAQFNRSITAGEEIQALEPGRNPRAVQVIYWGLAQAYALDRQTGSAWIGRPDPSGWKWTPCPEAAKRIGELIAIYDGKSDPDFVFVPGQRGRQPPSR